MNTLIGKNNYVRLGTILLSLGLVGACDHNDDDDPMPNKETLSYRVEVTNLSNNQPMSAILISLNDGRFMPWSAGGAASMALEKLAEGGDNSELLTMALAPENGSYSSASADGALAAGSSDAWTLEFEQEQGGNKQLNLSLLTMLVNTNDAFTGVASWSLDDLAVGEYKMSLQPAWDAGTEMNSELAGTIPGPADGGSGFSEVRDDVNFVHIHPSVVSNDDILVDSVLKAGHKFDNPVLQLKVTRLQ